MVAVLSARGKTTDELIAMAHEVSERPHPREMDMLLSTGERISCALAAMVINDLGHEAISLTGSQAGIVTDTSHTKARIIEVKADRIRSALDEDKIVLVAGFQGVSTGRLGRDDARPRRLRHHRGRTGRGAERRRVRDLHRRVGRLHGRPAHRAGTPASSASSRSRRCSRWRRRARRCYSYAPSSTHATTACESTADPASRTDRVPSCSEQETMEQAAGHSRYAFDRRGTRDAHGPARHPGRRRPRVHRAGRGERQRRHDHPERARVSEGPRADMSFTVPRADLIYGARRARRDQGRPRRSARSPPTPRWARSRSSAPE